MRIDESLRIVLDGLNESVYFLDMDGKISFANSMFSHRLGKSRSELEGRSIYDVVPPDIVEKRRHCIDEVIATAKAMTYEEERFGEVFLNSVSPILDSNRQVEAIAFIGTNITEQHKLLESLASINERLEAFTQAISHDIRGPLSAALGAAEILRAGSSPSLTPNNELLDEAMGVLISSLNKAVSLVDNLLMLAEAGNEKRAETETDVSEVVMEVLEENKSKIQKRHVRIDVSDSLGKVRIARTHIYQLFANLLGNSLDYNTDPSPALTVEYLGEEEDGFHRYRVRDNGPGLPTELIDSIFDPFVRGNNGHRGLGLAIVDRIVRTYQGYIWAHNDHGAVFEFALKDV